MKTLDVADLSRLPEELKSGDVIELVDGKRGLAPYGYPIRTKEKTDTRRGSGAQQDDASAVAR